MYITLISTRFSCGHHLNDRRKSKFKTTLSWLKLHLSSMCMQCQSTYQIDGVLSWGYGHHLADCLILHGHCCSQFHPIISFPNKMIVWIRCWGVEINCSSLSLTILKKYSRLHSLCSEGSITFVSTFWFPRGG